MDAGPGSNDAMETGVKQPACRLCGAELKETFVDLGSSPPCETYLTARAG